MNKRDRARRYEAARNAVIKAAIERQASRDQEREVKLGAAVDHLNELRKVNL